ncbi:hypothetical protein D3C73_787510 [compost metagenome]
MACGGKSNCNARMGLARISGTQPLNQCAASFTPTSSGSGWGETSSCSSAPLSWSCVNGRCRLSKMPSSAHTHSTPGPMARSSAGSGPTASGNSDPATTKNNVAPSVSAGRRQASRMSRNTN